MQPIKFTIRNLTIDENKNEAATNADATYPKISIQLILDAPIYNSYIVPFG